MKKLELNQIQNLPERENFRKIDEEFQRSPILSGEWKLFDLNFTAGGTYTVSHRLGFKPTDLIETFKTAAVTYNYSRFTSETLEITTPGAVNIRFLLGRMK